MARTDIDWPAFYRQERAFEQALAKGDATLLDHPLPDGGTLTAACDEQVALAAEQFEQKGHELLTLADWLRGKRWTPPHLEQRSALGRLLVALELQMTQA